jgi:RHS repeat-associated protein
VASSAPANNLGYLGNDERFTTGGALDLIQMGVRLYDPALGRFLEPDPLAGGSANAYDYCYQDPINCLDLAGTFSLRNFARSLHRVLSPIAQSLQAAAAATAILDAVPGCSTLPS